MDIYRPDLETSAHQPSRLRKLGQELRQLFETYGAVYPNTTRSVRADDRPHTAEAGVHPDQVPLRIEGMAATVDIPLGGARVIDECTVYNYSTSSYWQE